MHFRMLSSFFLFRPGLWTPSQHGTLLSSFSSGGGEFSPVIMHSATSPTPKGAVCTGGALVSNSAGLLEDTSQQHRGL